MLETILLRYAYQRVKGVKDLDHFALAVVGFFTQSHQTVIVDEGAAARSLELGHELLNFVDLSFVHDDVFGSTLKDFFVTVLFVSVDIISILQHFKLRYILIPLHINIAKYRESIMLCMLNPLPRRFQLRRLNFRINHYRHRTNRLLLRLWLKHFALIPHNSHILYRSPHHLRKLPHRLINHFDHGIETLILHVNHILNGSTTHFHDGVETLVVHGSYVLDFHTVHGNDVLEGNVVH